MAPIPISKMTIPIPVAIQPYVRARLGSAAFFACTSAIIPATSGARQAKPGTHEVRITDKLTASAISAQRSPPVLDCASAGTVVYPWGADGVQGGGWFGS